MVNCYLSVGGDEDEKVKTNSHINSSKVIFNAIVEKKSIFHHHQSLCPRIIIARPAEAEGKSENTNFSPEHPRKFSSLHTNIFQSFISHTLTMINESRLTKSLFSLNFFFAISLIPPFVFIRFRRSLAKRYSSVVIVKGVCILG